MHQTLHHHGPFASLRHALAAIDQVFCKLAQIQFSAPWRGRSGDC